MAVVVAAESVSPVRWIGTDIFFESIGKWFYVRWHIWYLLFIDHIIWNKNFSLFQIKDKDSIGSVSTLYSCYAVSAVCVPTEKCIDSRHKSRTADCPWDRNILSLF